MKALLSALAITTLAMTGCVAGPYDTYCSYQTYQPANQVYYPSQRSYYQCNQVYVDTPQFYRAVDYGCGATRYKNYSGTPVVVDRPGRSSVVVPQSWN